MGICNSTSNYKHKTVEIIEDKNLNYEWTPEENITKEASKNSIYKVNAELCEYIFDKNISRNKKKLLVSKYLYIDQYGKIFTQIPRKESKDIIKIEGNLDRKGYLRLKKIEQKIEGILTTTYEGKISRKISLCVEGIAITSSSISDENMTNERFPFSLEFSKSEWTVEYPQDGKQHYISAFLELNDNDNHISAISGISYEEEDKGVSIWKGIENDKRDITLTQQYIEDLRIASEDAKKIFYQGKIDRITHSIQGIIQGKDMDGIKFKICKKKVKGKN